VFQGKIEVDSGNISASLPNFSHRKYSPSSICVMNQKVLMDGGYQIEEAVMPDNEI
jgi:hypothetical protein